MTPIATPAKTERNKTIARDASNFQKRNEIATGIAFCIEKTVTTTMMINTIIRVIISYLLAQILFILRKNYHRVRPNADFAGAGQPIGFSFAGLHVCGGMIGKIWAIVVGVTVKACFP